MAVPDQTFAPPSLMLGKATVLPSPGVTPAPAGGQAFALEPDGTIPASLITSSSYITGQVASAGTVTAGTGFTVNRSATGTYDLTWDTAFDAAPTVLVSLVIGASILRQLRVNAASTTGATVFIATTVADSGAGANEPFNFVAFETV